MQSSSPSVYPGCSSEPVPSMSEGPILSVSETNSLGSPSVSVQREEVLDMNLSDSSFAATLLLEAAARLSGPSLPIASSPCLPAPAPLALPSDISRIPHPVEPIPPRIENVDPPLPSSLPHSSSRTLRIFNQEELDPLDPRLEGMGQALELAAINFQELKHSLASYNHALRQQLENFHNHSLQSEQRAVSAREESLLKELEMCRAQLKEMQRQKEADDMLIKTLRDRTDKEVHLTSQIEQEKSKLQSQIAEHKDCLHRDQGEVARCRTHVALSGSGSQEIIQAFPRSYQDSEGEELHLYPGHSGAD